MSKQVTIQMVSMKEPCTACHIIGGLLKDMLDKLIREYEGINVVYTILQHSREAAEVEGLEVEKFPALLINGEQITAGTLPDIRQLKQLLESELKND